MCGLISYYRILNRIWRGLEGTVYFTPALPGSFFNGRAVQNVHHTLVFDSSITLSAVEFNRLLKKKWSVVLLRYIKRETPGFNQLRMRLSSAKKFFFSARSRSLVALLISKRGFSTQQLTKSQKFGRFLSKKLYPVFFKQSWKGAKWTILLSIHFCLSILDKSRFTAMY